MEDVLKDRTKAMRWWDSLPEYASEDVLINGKHGLTVNYYQSRTWQSLTGREIEKIWNGEHRPEPKDQFIITDNVPDHLGYKGEPVVIMSNLDNHFVIVNNAKGRSWQCGLEELTLIKKSWEQ